MTTSAQRKGDKFERECRDYLRTFGWPVERIPSGMTDDRGDLGGLPFGFVAQLKSYSNVVRALSDGFRDLEVQQANAGASFGLVIVKRPRVVDPARQYAVMELGQLARFWSENSGA